MSVFLLIVVIVGVRHGHGRHAHEELREAKKVVIVGGGLVGVELAAEIAFAVSAPPLSCFLSTLYHFRVSYQPLYLSLPRSSCPEKARARAWKERKREKEETGEREGILQFLVV